MNRHVAALCAVSMLLAVPVEARPRDPFTVLVVGIGKVFAPEKARRNVRKQPTKSRLITAYRASKAKHLTKVAAIQYKATVDKPVIGHPDLDRYDEAPRVKRGVEPEIPSITVRPEPPFAKASGLKVLPDTQALRDIVVIYAKQHGIEAGLALALVQVESRFDPWAVGKAGEIGLMQIKCQTAIDEGFTGSCRSLYGVGVNLLYGMRYLAHAQRKSGGSQCGMLSRYNAGIYSGARRPDYCRRVQQAMR